MTNIDWIFFDLGWTLVDETEAHRARLDSTQHYLAEFGRVHSVDELMQMCERAATDFALSPFRGMLARLNLSEERVATILSSLHYPKDYEVLYAGVHEVLAKLSEHFKIGIIANQSNGTENRLTRWGIRSYFSSVLASAELGLAKPDPRIFAKALSEAGRKMPSWLVTESIVISGLRGPRAGTPCVFSKVSLVFKNRGVHRKYPTSQFRRSKN